MSVLDDLQPPRATPLAYAARSGQQQELLRVFARSTVYAPRLDDGSAWRELTRNGQRWLPVYDTYEALLAGEAPSPEAGVEHSQTSGRALRARLPEDLGLLLRLEPDEEYLVAYPALAPVYPVDLR